MRRARIPHDQISRIRGHLLPLAPALLEPLHPGVREAEPFRRPGWDALLVDEDLVEFLRDVVAAFANDEAAVVGAVGEEVHETLEAAEAGLEGVLVLMGPGDVGGEVGAAGCGQWGVSVG